MGRPTGPAPGPDPVPATKGYPSLTGARFVAALVVFGSHLHLRFPYPPLTHLGWTHQSSTTAVTFFFVLSGFVLTRSWRTGDRAGPFWRRRLARIAPIYLVTGALTVAYLYAVGEPPTLLALLVLATATQAWFYRPEYALNVPAWSLSCEVAFYFFFPAVMAVRGVLQIPWARRVVLVVLLIVHQLVSVRTRSTFPPFAALAFLAGVVLGHEPVSDRSPRGLVPAAIAAFVLGQVALADGPHGLGGTAEALGLATTVLLVGALAASDATRGPGGFGRLAPLGLISYAFYMVHYLVLRVVAKVVRHVSPDYPGHPAQVALAAAVSLAGSLVAAWALFHGVERPLERRLRGTRTRIEVTSVEPNADLAPAVGP